MVFDVSTTCSCDPQFVKLHFGESAAEAAAAAADMADSSPLRLRRSSSAYVTSFRVNITPPAHRT